MSSNMIVRLTTCTSSDFRCWKLKETRDEKINNKHKHGSPTNKTISIKHLRYTYYLWFEISLGLEIKNSRKKDKYIALK